MKTEINGKRIGRSQRNFPRATIILLGIFCAKKNNNTIWHMVWKDVLCVLCIFLFAIANFIHLLDAISIACLFCSMCKCSYEYCDDVSLILLQFCISVSAIAVHNIFCLSRYSFYSDMTQNTLLLYGKVYFVDCSDRNFLTTFFYLPLYSRCYYFSIHSIECIWKESTNDIHVARCGWKAHKIFHFNSFVSLGIPMSFIRFNVWQRCKLTQVE